MIFDGIVSDMMHVPTPDDIEQACVAKGISLSAMQRRAGISGTTFFRWKRCGNITSTNLQKMIDAINQQEPAGVSEQTPHPQQEQQ